MARLRLTNFVTRLLALLFLLPSVREAYWPSASRPALAKGPLANALGWPLAIRYKAQWKAIQGLPLGRT